jgi:eukaryotic-like serine/threonine-protein kinase
MAVGASFLLLIAAGFGISRLMPFGSSSLAWTEPAVVFKPADVGAANVSKGGDAATRGPGLKVGAQLVAASSPTASPVVPPSANLSSVVSLPTVSSTLEPAVDKTRAELNAAAKAEARAAAKKVTLEKEKLAKQTHAASVAAAAAAGHADPDSTVAKRVPSPPAPAVASTVVAAGGNPKQACEDRMLLGFQMCMTEQCAKRAYSSHPVCVERHAMDERRRETEHSRR